MALTQLLARYPLEAANLVVQCLRKQHPTAALISQLEFTYETDPHEGLPSLDVSGPGLRISGEAYGRIASIRGCEYLDMDKFAGWIQRFFYHPRTGEPIPGWSHTPTTWLENWDTDVLEEIEMDEEMRTRLREIWD
jgi:hypothetical protein